MKRIVGLHSSVKKAQNAKPPEPGINDVVNYNDQKANDIDSKISACDTELRRIRQQLQAQPTGVTRQILRDKAKSILTRKNAYEKQAEDLRMKSFNLDSLAMSLNSANNMDVTVKALKEGTKQMRKELAKINLDEVEDLQDDLGDLINLTDDVQTALAKNYTVPEDIDDEELNNQLEMLGDEIVQDNDTSYMDEALKAPTPTIAKDDPNSNKNSSQTPNPNNLDEFGLPILNSAHGSASTAETSKQ